MADLRIDAKCDGPIGLVRLSGEARLEVVDGLRKATRGLQALGARHVLVSLKDVTFADSASVGAVLELEKEVSTAGGILVLHTVPVRIARMLDAMGLSGRLRIAPTEVAARALCGPAKP